MQLELPHWPLWALIATGGGSLLLAVLGCWLVVAAARRAGVRRGTELATAATAATSDTTPEQRAREQRARVLVRAAATVCLALWLGLFASSFQAISGFARSFLHREGLAVPTTPLTLDGVVAGALLLALAFIARRKSPQQANLLIWGMTGFAAFCGFTYGDSGTHGSAAAGAYYAVMSIVGMWMLHMVMELFADGEGDYIRSKYPSMGLRWFTHWSTLPVFLAWINHPPRHRTTDQRPTTREAIDHWNRLRTVRARAARIRAAEQHEQRLITARRKAELDAARTVAAPSAAPVSPAPRPAPAAPVMPGWTPTPPAIEAGSVPPPVAHPAPGYRMPIPQAAPVSPPTGSTDEDTTEVPATPATCEQWMKQWTAICQQMPALAVGQTRLSADDLRSRFDIGERHLRKLRAAARSGRLREQAEALGVAVPDGYVDWPHVNGRVTAPVG